MTLPAPSARLLGIATLFALGVACAGDLTRNLSTNTLSGLFFDEATPGGWTATVSGTVEGPHTSTLTLSGSALLRESSAATATVRFDAVLDGVTVATDVLSFDTPFPQDFSLAIDDVFGDCPTGSPCEVLLDVTVTTDDGDGLVESVSGALQIQATDVALGDGVVSNASATLSE